MREKQISRSKICLFRRIVEKNVSLEVLGEKNEQFLAIDNNINESISASVCYHDKDDNYNTIFSADSFRIDSKKKEGLRHNNQASMKSKGSSNLKETITKFEQGVRRNLSNAETTRPKVCVFNIVGQLMISNF